MKEIFILMRKNFILIIGSEMTSLTLFHHHYYIYNTTLTYKNSRCSKTKIYIKELSRSNAKLKNSPKDLRIKNYGGLYQAMMECVQEIVVTLYCYIVFYWKSFLYGFLYQIALTLGCSVLQTYEKCSVVTLNPSYWTII